MTDDLYSKNAAPVIVWPKNPFQPATKDIFKVASGSTIADWIHGQKIEEFPLPTVCLINGKPLMRADWPTYNLANRDVVVFVGLPGGGGGGGSNPLRVVLSIAVMVLAPYAAAGIMGYGTTAAGIAAAQAAMGTVGFGLMAAGVSVIGAYLVNALVPLPNPSVPSAQNGIAPSPTYSLQSQGNFARLLQPIPVIYGRHLVYPDLGATPYTEYVDNEQYLHQLLVIGQGEYEVEAIRIEDTPIQSFSEVQALIIQPGNHNALFNHDVVTAPEVAGQEVLAETDPENTRSEIVGPFITNPPETHIDAIGIDILLPSGLFYANDSGGQDTKSTSWVVQARQVDDQGVPSNAWQVLGSESISAASPDAIRRSYRYSIAPGRYEVRILRSDNKDTRARAGHELRWGELRGYLTNPSLPAGITYLAVKMRATDNLSMRSSRLVNCIVTRKLPTWNPTDGWKPPQPTRSIAWAFADAARATYGANLTDKRIDLNALYQTHQNWEARGDHFDAVFDQKLTVWESLTRIARCGRAVPYMQSGVVRIVRDETKTLPVVRFTTENIVQGSFKLQYVMPGEETADSVTVEYFNPNTWKPDEVTVSLPDSIQTNPATINLFGCTSQSQAEREGKYIAAANRYRRRLITFQTEMEGMIPTFSDLISVSHDMAVEQINSDGTPVEYLARVMAARPRGEHVEITCVVEHPLVHSADL
jgi:sulfur carrier protein ThiS